MVDPFYDECGLTKTCFGSPDGCLSNQDCVAVTAVRVEGTRYLFEMKARNAAYVAVGISEDQKMVIIGHQLYNSLFFFCLTSKIQPPSSFPILVNF